ncbi:hypothetical protein MAPG_06969 [Magnaporthiopsis poae ATCC 64411]|uniref:Uncharacterized protein n=1 Tax=Magnaporthiopsis poae (strain ATCC 64411 / 73-15) TaxID=644358 RepID=A0A0C4E3H0_MAGP6|nr:hypothetical protein MAPG_06969 [Magnaporthiopsis poae ATCC 64411]
MGDMYESASLVTVWLRSPSLAAILDITTSYCASYFPVFIHSRQQQQQQRNSSQPSPHEWQDMRRRGRNLAGCPSHVKMTSRCYMPLWKPLLHLLEHELFEQVWVAQEVAPHHGPSRLRAHAGRPAGARQQPHSAGIQRGTCVLTKWANDNTANLHVGPSSSIRITNGGCALLVSQAMSPSRVCRGARRT